MSVKVKLGHEQMLGDLHPTTTIYVPALQTVSFLHGEPSGHVVSNEMPHIDRFGKWAHSFQIEVGTDHRPFLFPAIRCLGIGDIVDTALGSRWR